LFQLVSAYSLSQNTIESAETSRLFHLPNQPKDGRDTFQKIKKMEYYSFIYRRLLIRSWYSLLP
jgi:hypothetical protein